MDKARVIQVVETTILRRGDGLDNRSPIRIITQYWSLEGELLAEVDPCSETLPIEAVMYDRKSCEQQRRDLAAARAAMQVTPLKSEGEKP